MKTVALARRMYGDGDSWTPTQIVRYLAEQGVEVHRHTVMSWVRPGWAEEQRRWNRESHRRRNGRPESPEGWEARMVELRVQVGLTCAPIARLLKHDFGVRISEERVRRLVGHLPRGQA